MIIKKFESLSKDRFELISWDKYISYLEKKNH